MSVATKKTGTPIYQRYCLVFELVLMRPREIVNFICFTDVSHDFQSMFLLFPPSNVTNSVKEHRARIVQTIEEAHAIARANNQRTKQTIKARYDRSACEPKFMLGDREWVYTPKTKKSLSRKLLHHGHGPFSYHRIMLTNHLVSITVHANRMKP